MTKHKSTVTTARALGKRKLAAAGLGGAAHVLRNAAGGSERRSQSQPRPRPGPLLIPAFGGNARLSQQSPLTAATVATTKLTGAGESTLIVTNFTPTNYALNGVNLVAAEVHQASAAGVNSRPE